MKILFLLVLFTYSAIAQTISITVINSDTKLPVSDVNVKIDTLYITKTDNTGQFHLKVDTTQSKFLLLSCIGFETKTFELTYLIKNNIKAIQLKPVIIPSQTILVTSSLTRQFSSISSFSSLSKLQIENSTKFADFPELLSSLPSTTFYTESGNSIGYSYINIRGFDQRRISIAINGITQNDPEDHNVYWVDFADLISSSDLIQVQRGAGNGIIGYPSIGGSINIITTGITHQPKILVESSFGSFNSYKNSLAVSSGIIDNKYSIFTRISKINSAGYRDNAWSDFTTLYFSFQTFYEKFVNQLNIYGSLIKDGLAYNGIPKFAIKDSLSYRKKNFSYWEAENNDITFFTTRRSTEIENFYQPHIELLNEYILNDNFKINSTLFYFKGEGFYDYDGSWADTNYLRLTNANGFKPVSNPVNTLIRAYVNNDQFGWIPKINFKVNKTEIIIGSEIKYHKSLHWGSIIFGTDLPIELGDSYRFYEYNASKIMFNGFIYSNHELNEKTNLLLEIQYAYNKYKIFNEKYVNTNLSVTKNFLNFRVGIGYKINENLNSSFSFARVSREPRLKNYYDAAESSGGASPQFEKYPDGSYNFNAPLVKPETMNNLEVGFEFLTKDFNSKINLYYMLFENEIVKNGKLDRFGQPVTGNADKTLHYGLEFSNELNLLNNFKFSSNLTVSNNYILKGKEYIVYNNNSSKEIIELDISKNKISGFPNFLFNSQISYRNYGLLVRLEFRYTGEYYSDNYANNLLNYLGKYNDFVDYNDNKIDGYELLNLYVSYDIPFFISVNKLTIHFSLNNIFNRLYAMNAFGKEFFPAAERNYVLGLKLDL